MKAFFSVLLLGIIMFSINIAGEQVVTLLKFETGTLPALDKNNKPIIFEGSPVKLQWYKTTDHATMVELQKQALPVLAQAFADEVRNFLLDEQLSFRKEYAYMSGPPPEDKPEKLEEPKDTHEALNDKLEEKSGENPFITNARSDRATRVEFSRQQFEQWFAVTAQAMYEVPFTYFFVMAKNSKGDILGVTAFYISSGLTKFFPEFDVYTEGDVVLDPLAIAPAAQGIGLARPLVFSILKLAPEIKRIFLGTRIWITNAIAMYNKLGFTEYKREGIGVKFKYVVKK